jgi:hypothetical protein
VLAGNMTISPRSLIKNVALAVHRPLRPLLRTMGVDARSPYELAYWKSRQIEEGTLGNIPTLTDKMARSGILIVKLEKRV